MHLTNDPCLLFFEFLLYDLYWLCIKFIGVVWYRSYIKMTFLFILVNPTVGWFAVSHCYA
jgi:hypothetical protein